MAYKKNLILLLVIFCAFCGYLVIDSGLFKDQSADSKGCILLQATNPEELSGAIDEPQPVLLATPPVLSVENAPSKTFIIGADDPCTHDPSQDNSFKLQLELTTRGASIKNAIYANGNGNGFDDRDPKNPKPFKLLAPIKLADGREMLSMANAALIFDDYGLQLPLDKLNWHCRGIEEAPDGCEKVTFTTEVKDKTSGQALLKLTKTFSLPRDSYMANCNISLENLSANPQKVRFNLNGPVGITREDVRTDARKTFAAFRDSAGQIVSKDKAIRKAAKADTIEDLRMISGSDKFLWAATTNKYFAAIAVPSIPLGKDSPDWIADKLTRYYDPDGDVKQDSGTECITFELKTTPVTLEPAGADNSKTEYGVELYLGPKDKRLFDNNDYYKSIGFHHTIDFLACCCPASIIRPLAFFVMWLMNTIYGIIHNYGIAIIILVCIVRLVLHPVTKAGQVRMSRFTKILSSPEVAEIKKKYAKNKIEMQKQISVFQKSKGVSPADALWGMLPMMMQMPIWIALWSSVNASIDLRGAAFLPFWITDLSVPDAIIRWTPFIVPLLGWKISSLNLLPLLMGVAFYLQQKTMPQQPAATPEAAQQQKIMKLMMLVMFPIMLYNAPSGVSLYIMASSFAGAYEQYIIRKHIKEKEEQQSRGLIEVTSKTGGKVKKKKPKPTFKKYM